MGDISTWNPVDNSNTTAPPDGWPEGMAPSAVNNSARAMMGAVRRWYDTVTAQLANFLPLTGGTVTGNLSVTGTINAGTTMNAGSYIVFGHAFAEYSGGGGGTIVIREGGGGAALSLQAANSYYDNDIHQFRNNALTPTFTVNAAGDGVFAGNISGWDISAGGTVSTQNLNASGTVTAAQLTSTGNINAAGTVTGTSFIGNVSVPGGGTLSTTGTVTGGQVTSTGNMNASGNITASSDLIAGNNITAGNKIFAQSLEIDVDAYLGTATINNGLQVTNGTCWNLSGSWTALSDAALKDDIAPYRRGLDAVLALNPVSFRYRPEVFGDDSARIMQFGLVANEVAPLVPEMVGETMLGDRVVSTLTPGHLAFVLINACKELSTQNAALAARITALEGTHV